MADKLEMDFGYVDREIARVGAYSIPLSPLESLRHAEERGSRVLTSAERGKAMELAEKNMQKALQSKNPKEIQDAENLLLHFYGIKSDGIGYAGARDLTSTILNFNEGSITEANGISRGARDYIYGRKGNYGWMSELEKKTRGLQAGGLTAFIQEFDPEIGLPVKVGEEPNQKYHGAVFWISPNVKEMGVVTRGQHHAVGELCAKYDVMILPPDYKDIMLGHRTVSDTDRANLASIIGIGSAFIGGLVENTRLGRISQEEAIQEIGKYSSAKRMSRRGFNSTLTLFLATLAGCGGGGSGGGGPPPPPPEQKYEYAGSVAKRIANDGSKVNIGRVVLEGTRGTFGADINSAGDFKITGIKSGTYKRTTRDNNGDSIYVPQVESVVAINSNLTGQNSSVIERGANRFGVDFDSNFQDFYEELGLRKSQVTPGAIKWGNGSGQSPQKIIMRASTIPSDVQAAFKNSVDFVIARDTPTFSGGRITSLPSEFRETPGDYEIEVKIEDLGNNISDYPLLNGKRIIRARTRYHPVIAESIRGGGDVSSIISHEYFICFGAIDINKPIKSIMNPFGSPDASPVATNNDKLAAFLINHPDVQPGKTAPDTNH